MDIGRCFNDAIEVYKKNLVPLVVAALLFELLTLISLTILAGPLSVGWCLMTLKAMRSKEKRVEIGDLFGAFHKFLPSLGLFYLTFFAIIIGLVLCVAPGIWLMTIWIFSFFLMVDQDQPVFASLRISRELVRRSGIGNYVLLVLIITALMIAPEAIPFVGLVVGWFLIPLAFLLEASAYIQEVDEKKPLPIED